MNDFSFEDLSSLLEKNADFCKTCSNLVLINCLLSSMRLYIHMSYKRNEDGYYIEGRNKLKIEDSEYSFYFENGAQKCISVIK